MKIQNCNVRNILYNSPVNKTEKVPVSIKTVQQNSSKVSADYNIAFHGLFKRKNPEEKPFDAKLLEYDLAMRPDMEFEVSSDSKFELGTNGYILDLGANNIKAVIDNLQKNQEIIIGREPESPNNLVQRTFFNPNLDLKYILSDASPLKASKTPMDISVSRKHLKIKRNNQGKLIAQDLNSKCGSKILRNIVKPDYNNINSFSLEKGFKYFLPRKSVFRIGDSNFILQDHISKFNRLKEGQSLIVGGDRQADIKITDREVLGANLRLTKYDDGILAEDINPIPCTAFLGLLRNYNIDYSFITEPASLRQGFKTKVPRNSQLYIGSDLTIDFRNKNLLNELNQKGVITVGRDETCDFIVPSFYDKVSRKHLQIEKDGEDIIVTDLSSTNGTVVVPNGHIKPFYGDLSNLNLKQNNTGDCYLLSTIYSMSQNPVGRRYLENMVRVDNDGNYIVKFYNRPEIVVSPDELDGQTDKQGKKKYSVSGDLGIKAIERAYGKMLKSGSWWPVPEMTMHVLDKGGYSEEALQRITGIPSECHTIKNNRKLDEILYRISYSGGKENHILTCSTPDNAQYGRYVDPNHQFIKNHAYSIQYVDQYSQTIGIVNPHNTKYLYNVSWSDFKKYFDYLYDANT